MGVVPGFHFFFHYLQLLTPPLAVVTGLLLADAPTPTRVRVLAASAAVAVACAAVSALPVADQTRVDGDLVAAVRAEVPPGQRILVWGAMPEVYWRTDRMPAAPFLSVGYRLLPKGRAAGAGPAFNIDDYTAEARLPTGSQFVGRTGEAARVDDGDEGAELVCVEHDRSRFSIADITTIRWTDQSSGPILPAWPDDPPARNDGREEWLRASPPATARERFGKRERGGPCARS